MLVLQSTHNAVIASLRDKIALLEQLLASVERDRDFYRSQWTKREIGTALPPYLAPDDAVRIAAEKQADERMQKMAKAQAFRDSLTLDERAVVSDWAAVNFPGQDAWEAYIARFGETHPADALAE